MPGVPPNALAQVKKGLKGLFSRKQKKNAKGSTSQTPSAVAGPSAEAKNEGSASMTPNGLEYEANVDWLAMLVEPTSSATPQIAEPGNVSSSQAIDLNPAAPAPAKEEGKLDAKNANDGMSATSGPVSTDLYGEEGTGTAPATASKDKAKEKTKDTDSSSEEAIEDMEEGHAKMEGAAAAETKPGIEESKAA